MYLLARDDLFMYEVVYCLECISSPSVCLGKNRCRNLQFSIRGMVNRNFLHVSFNTQKSPAQLANFFCKPRIKYHGKRTEFFILNVLWCNDAPNDIFSRYSKHLFCCAVNA